MGDFVLKAGSPPPTILPLSRSQFRGSFLPRTVTRAPRASRSTRRTPQPKPHAFNPLGILARALILFLVVVIGWKLVNFSFATFEEAKFQQSNIIEHLPPA